MAKSFNERLEQTNGLVDVFELVKEAVQKVQNTSRAGLTLGLAELGGGEDYFIGAYYPFGSNIIIMNKTPLRRILESKPRLFKPYLFHILLHEYIHALGNLDEDYTRDLTHRISSKVFGGEHVATQMAKDLNRFIPDLVYPASDWMAEKDIKIEMVYDFDRSSVNYIA